jgi:membrane-bound ClpP family serine protease
VIGLSLLVVAVILQFALFGVAGFLVMLAGLVLATSSNAGLESQPKQATKPQAAKSERRSFFEDRWDKRQGQ